MYYRRVVQWYLAPDESKEPKDKIAMQLARDMDISEGEAKLIITPPDVEPEEEEVATGVYITAYQKPPSRTRKSTFFRVLLTLLNFFFYRWRS